MAKVLEFQPQHQSSRIEWFDLLAVQETCQESSPAPQFQSINSSVLSFLYGPTLTSTHDYWKNCGGGGGLVTRSCPTLAIPWTVACQAPLSMGFSRREYWSGLPFPSPGDLPDPGLEPTSSALQAMLYG